MQEYYKKSLPVVTSCEHKILTFLKIGLNFVTDETLLFALKHVWHCDLEIWPMAEYCLVW